MGRANIHMSQRIEFMPLTVGFSFMLALLTRISNVLFSSSSVQ
jgi:hypothetical protein